MNPCDFSLGKPQSAEKVCLNKEASLSKHCSKNAQKDLSLVTPNAGGYPEERRCREHAKMLDCYCQDDLACVCAMCSSVGSHKGHSIVALKEEHDKQRVILSLTMKSIQENKNAVNKVLMHLQKSEDQIKYNKKSLTVQLSKLFQEIKSQVNQKEKQILGDIQSNEEKQLADIFALKKKAEGKRDAALHGLQELQMLTKQADAFRFLKDFQLAQERIKKQNSSNESVEVLTVHLDESVIQDVRSHTEAYLSNLDNLMQVVHGKIINQTQWCRAIPAAEFSLDDVVCEVFPSPPSPQTRKLSGTNSAAAHLTFGNMEQDP
ncbi:tripartite motif-containing protein 29-like [Eublepharis macularius]|uniref:Tripartite motif-containing protein 29-like n=1 Tax=Eublepharis macularius TaxID=481883 RepID=A0AA97J6T1_EUBMA|nr:tripartite motif-containing protein 29-like [Eublepharis macularius]